MNFEDFMKYCIIQKIPLDWMGYNIFYLHYLVTRGNEESIYNWLEAFSADKQVTMLNDMEIFDYTALHRVCYWISGPKALRICQEFVARGCIIQKDKLDRMPWEIEGNFYVNILTGKTIGQRDVTAFIETYEMIKEWVSGLGCKSFVVNKLYTTPQWCAKMNRIEPVSPYSLTPQSLLQTNNAVLRRLETIREASAKAVF